MPNTVRVQLIPADRLPPVEGLDLPTVEAHTYVLVDDDQRVCRVIDEDELEASYVDNGIDTFTLRGVDWLTLDVDRHYVDITYTDDRTAAVLLGSIDFGAGVRAPQYAKKDGVIYPIDDGGALLLNRVNAPKLVAVRTWYWKEAKRVNDERIEIAELVHVFGDAIGHLGHMGEHLGSMEH